MSTLSDIFGSGFDPSQHESSSFNVIPPGKYPVMIEKAEVKETKSGNGHYLELTLLVVDGQYKNRKLWSRLNIDNPDQTCVKIALGQLGDLTRALGFTELNSETQLLNGFVIAHVRVRDDQNEVRTYSSVSGQQAPVVPKQPTPAAQGDQAVQDVKGVTPELLPWQRSSIPF